MVDGEAWRAFPLDVLAASGVSVGAALDRPRLRLLRRELRRWEAVDAGARALARGDQSRAALAARLARPGLPRGAQGEALEVLERAGLVDDDSAAARRAALLAERGMGDLAIRQDLERRTFESEAVESALSALEPEWRRAQRLARTHDDGRRAARTLLRKGFGVDAVEAACPGLVAEGP